MKNNSLIERAISTPFSMHLLINEVNIVAKTTINVNIQPQIVKGLLNYKAIPKVKSKIKI